MRLLIIGSLEGHMSAASHIALKRGAKVSSVESIDDGLALLRQGKGADVAMIDVRMNIERLVNALNSERINVPVVACGLEDTDPETAAAAIGAGAQEFIPLPPDPELISAVLEAVAQESTSVVSRDVAMQKVLKLADQIAPSDASVLITGESGTGKEVMARYIHGKSKRASGTFVALNCAAIPENLLESELFGHEKGAFSGAVSRRIGKFEEANGGTILLDEVSEMDPRLQAKLLRAIQEREIDRVGSNKPVKIDVRILATSNRDLQKSVKDGDFREDLYFRLNVVNLQLPSLRDRPHDVAALADHFIKKYSEANGIPVKPLSKAALDRMQAYSWPGNVRELENTLHRAVLLSQENEIEAEAIMLTGGLLADDKPSPMAAMANLAGNGASPAAASPAQTFPTSPAPQPSEMQPSAPPTSSPGAGGMDVDPSLVGRTVADVERQLIIDTLGHCLGNRTHAANILGISIRTLRNKLKQYGDEGFAVPQPGESEHRA